MTTPPPPAPDPSCGLLLRVWFLLGVQSFGGGAASLALIRRAMVEQYRWVSEEQFTRDFAICQMTPGINQLALTLLLGRRLGGPAGGAVSLLGFLLPSVTITILLTAFYARIRDAEVVKAALHGVVPATVGIGLLTAIQMARSPLQTSRQAGTGWFILALAFLVGSGAAAASGRLPVVLILISVGALSALVHGRAAAITAKPPKMDEAGE